MPSIRIDDDVFEFLKTHAEPLIDTPNDVLRRLFRLTAPRVHAVPQRRVHLLRMPTSEEMAPQGRGILECLNANGGAMTVDALCENLPNFVQTKQTVRSVFGYYKKWLIDEGYIAIREDLGLPSAQSSSSDAR